MKKILTTCLAMYFASMSFMPNFAQAANSKKNDIKYDISQKEKLVASSNIKDDKSLMPKSYQRPVSTQKKMDDNFIKLQNDQHIVLRMLSLLLIMASGYIFKLSISKQ